MIIKNKEEKKYLKQQICQAMINTSGCLAFVAMQDSNKKNNCEFKKLNTFYDKMSNLWNYLVLCIDNDLDVDISNYSYNLILNLADIDVEEYKSYFENYEEYFYYG